MARQLAPRRRQQAQPRGTHPRLRGEFADAVFVYLPVCSGLNQAKNHRLALNQNSGAQYSIRFGRWQAWFDDSSIAVQSGTAGISFENTGMTVLTVGFYSTTPNGSRNMVNRLSAGNTGGFNVNYFNSAGGGGFFFSSYNKPGVGDTNWDSAWVDGVKTIDGNGDPATSIDTRYVFAGCAAIGPAASAATEFTIGREGANPGGQVGVELVVIWPRKFNEQLMERITRDPYSIFWQPGRLAVNSISTDVTVGLSGVSSTGSVNGPGAVQITSAALSALTGTSSINAILADISKVMSAQTATGSINGFATVGIATVALSTLSGTGSVGTISVESSSGDKTIGVTGVSATGSVGTLDKQLTKELVSLLAVTPVGAVTSSGGTLVQTGNPWRSVAFYPSVVGFRGLAEHASVAGNQSV